MLVRSTPPVTVAAADAALTMLEIDQDGLDEMDKRLLEALIHKFDGGPVGLNSLAVSVGEEAGTLEEVHEPYLIMDGFLKRTPQGRVAAKRAYDKLGLKPTARSRSFLLDRRNMRDRNWAFPSLVLFLMFFMFSCQNLAMKTYRHELIFNLPARRGFVNITDKVQDCVGESHVTEGLVLVNSMHISASVFINDHEGGLLEDWERGWKSSRRKNRTASTGTTTPARTTPTRISSAPSWAAKWSSPSPTASSTSARGNRFSTASSTACAASACW